MSSWVSGMPKIIHEVRVDLEIRHGDRRDLLVILETPNKKRLPFDEGELDTNGQEVLFENEDAPLFYGLNPNGRWVQRVIDTLAGDEGLLISATVHITAADDLTRQKRSLSAKTHRAVFASGNQPPI